MTKAESAASRTPNDWGKCGHCGYPLTNNDTVISYGTYHAHPESRCRAIMRERISSLELEAADLRSCIKDLRERLAKAEAALSDIAEGPQPFHEYLFGIRCGVEDQGLQGNVYEAAEYAFQAGVEYCQDIAASALAHPKGEDHGNG